MAFLRLEDARALGLSESRRAQKRASVILSESVRSFSKATHYDVFLSHSFQDADAILGIKTAAERAGMKVYVDWLDDPGLDRRSVTAETADVIRGRLRASASLVYVHSPNASDSKWMPWELGFFDGSKPGFVWIMPLVVSDDSEFQRQEYLGLYPTIENIGSIGTTSSVVNLGFRKVRLADGVSDVPLVKAARAGNGIILTM